MKILAVLIIAALAAIALGSPIHLSINQEEGEIDWVALRDHIAGIKTNIRTSYDVILPIIQQENALLGNIVKLELAAAWTASLIPLGQLNRGIDRESLTVNSTLKLMDVLTFAGVQAPTIAITPLVLNKLPDPVIRDLADKLILFVSEHFMGYLKVLEALSIVEIIQPPAINPFRQQVLSRLQAMQENLNNLFQIK